VEVGRTIIGGIAEGCRQAGCALIGGETAEMPGLYAGDDFDLAGFCVGAAERGRILNGEAVREGDVVLGLASSGAHANGFSLIRKLVAALALDYHAPAPFDPSRPLGLALLTPTRIYVKSCLAALAAGGVGAFAHITGGGLTENLPRVLPPSLAVALDAGRWPLPPLFGWLAAAGGLSSAELARTFNCGIGMAVIAAADRADGVGAVLQQAGEQVAVIGKVVRRQADRPAVVLSGTERAWKS
jgi:phosphoribosylformylglycinamidine cyclo-ligase